MQYLEKVCCFFVFARVFLHMCPNDKYEKYLSALTSWIAFCIFLSPFLSGDMFRQSYEMWEENWKTQAELQIGVTADDIARGSELAAEQIVEEIEPEDYKEKEEEESREEKQKVYEGGADQ